MQRPVVLAVLALAGAAAAQMRGPLPGLPMCPPPVPHPALAAQPLIDNGSSMQPATPPPAMAAAGCPEPTGDPATSGPKLAGRDLKDAVKKVASLKWHEELGQARAQAAAYNKPILWIQALGDLEGFA